MLPFSCFPNVCENPTLQNIFYFTSIPNGQQRFARCVLSLDVLRISVTAKYEIILYCLIDDSDRLMNLREWISLLKRYFRKCDTSLLHHSPRLQFMTFLLVSTSDLKIFYHSPFLPTSPSTFLTLQTLPNFP